MKKTIAAFDFIMSFLAVVAMALIANGFPSAVSQYSSEPEDVYILISLIVLCISMAIVSGLTALYMLDKCKKEWLRPYKLMAGNLVASVILIFLAIIGFTSNEVSVKELRLLTFPGLIFLASFLAIKKNVKLCNNAS